MHERAKSCAVPRTPGIPARRLFHCPLTPIRAFLAEPCRAPVLSNIPSLCRKVFSKVLRGAKVLIILIYLALRRQRCLRSPRPFIVKRALLLYLTDFLNRVFSRENAKKARFLRRKIFASRSVYQVRINHAAAALLAHGRLTHGRAKSYCKDRGVARAWQEI